MPRFDDVTVQKAKNWDVVSYLQRFEPEELVDLGHGRYTTKTHDSLKISNGKWYWFSRNIGGHTALDYLIKVKEMPFRDAVSLLVGMSVDMQQGKNRSPEGKVKQLLMPELDQNCDKVKAYLQKRGIHAVIIDYCIENKLLFQTKDYKNALFVGYDNEGEAKYGALRSTISAYKGELTGSDKHYSFSIAENLNAELVHVFESAIDLLSFLTLELIEGRAWKEGAYVSLAGVFAPKRTGVVPVALQRFLNDHPQIKTVHLHLDYDEVGRAASAGIIEGLMEKYTVINEPPTRGKDINEMLQLRVGLLDRDSTRGTCKAETIEYDEG